MCTTKIAWKAIQVWSFYYFLCASLASWLSLCSYSFCCWWELFCALQFLLTLPCQIIYFCHFIERNATTDKVSVVDSGPCLVLMRVTDFVPIVYKTLDCLVSPTLFVRLVAGHYSLFCLGMFLWRHLSCFNFLCSFKTYEIIFLLLAFDQTSTHCFFLFLFFRVPLLIVSVYMVTKTDYIFCSCSGRSNYFPFWLLSWSYE